MDEAKLSLRWLMKKMQSNYKPTLEDEILDKIGEFIITTSENNLVLIEYWIKKARERRTSMKKRVHHS